MKIRLADTLAQRVARLQRKSDWRQYLLSDRLREFALYIVRRSRGYLTRKSFSYFGRLIEAFTLAFICTEGVLKATLAVVMVSVLLEIISDTLMLVFRSELVMAGFWPKRTVLGAVIAVHVLGYVVVADYINPSSNQISVLYVVMMMQFVCHLASAVMFVDTAPTHFQRRVFISLYANLAVIALIGGACYASLHLVDGVVAIFLVLAGGIIARLALDVYVWRCAKNFAASNIHVLETEKPNDQVVPNVDSRIMFYRAFGACAQFISPLALVWMHGVSKFSLGVLGLCLLGSAVVERPIRALAVDLFMFFRLRKWQIIASRQKIINKLTVVLNVFLASIIFLWAYSASDLMTSLVLAAFCGFYFRNKSTHLRLALVTAELPLIAYQFVPRLICILIAVTMTDASMYLPWLCLGEMLAAIAAYYQTNHIDAAVALEHDASVSHAKTRSAAFVGPIPFLLSFNTLDEFFCQQGIPSELISVKLHRALRSEQSMRDFAEKLALSLRSCDFVMATSTSELVIWLPGCKDVSATIFRLLLNFPFIVQSCKKASKAKFIKHIRGANVLPDVFSEFSHQWWAEDKYGRFVSAGRRATAEQARIFQSLKGRVEDSIFFLRQLPSERDNVCYLALAPMGHLLGIIVSDKSKIDANAEDNDFRQAAVSSFFPPRNVSNLYLPPSDFYNVYSALSVVAKRFGIEVSLCQSRDDLKQSIALAYTDNGLGKSFFLMVTMRALDVSEIKHAA